MPELLRLEGLSKKYGSLQVTDDVSLSLAEGETLGVIGPKIVLNTPLCCA